MLLDARRKKRRALSEVRFGRHAQGRLGPCAKLFHSRKPFGGLAREAREVLGVDPPRGVVAFGRAVRGPTAALPGNLRGNKLLGDILSTKYDARRRRRDVRGRERVRRKHLEAKERRPMQRRPHPVDEFRRVAAHKVRRDSQPMAPFHSGIASASIQKFIGAVGIPLSEITAQSGRCRALHAEYDVRTEAPVSNAVDKRLHRWHRKSCASRVGG